MNANENMHLLDDLQALLEKQIRMARKGNFRRVELLAEESGLVAEKIAQIKLFAQPKFDDRRAHLLKLYKQLELILAAGKASVGGQLRQVGDVRKTLKVYQNNGSF